MFNQIFQRLMICIAGNAPLRNGESAAVVGKLVGHEPQNHTFCALMEDLKLCFLDRVKGLLPFLLELLDTQ